MKKIFSGCLTIIVIFIVLGVIIGACSNDSDDKADNTNKTATSTEKKEGKKAVSKDTTQKSKETKKAKEYKIGDTVKVGKMQYKVNSISLADQVGPSALPTKASEKFVVIEVSVKNNGDKAVTVDSNFFKLLKENKTFEADSAGSMSANQSESGDIDNSFFLQEVNPESQISGKVVFDVANTVAQSKDLKLQVQTGVFGTETEVIKLKK
ncbi:DUF4352 domain-containing protein [Rummeliibacillus stabekisii]|uniref:DUF4352 domain-containing protein n=1 Tax=Rummeliibacillus stabekisii TaxID=241244 RepID=UPI003721D8E4